MLRNHDNLDASLEVLANRPLLPEIQASLRFDDFHVQFAIPFNLDDMLELSETPHRKRILVTEFMNHLDKCDVVAADMVRYSMRENTLLLQDHIRAVNRVPYSAHLHGSLANRAYRGVYKKVHGPLSSRILRDLTESAIVTYSHDTTEELTDDFVRLLRKSGKDPSTYEIWKTRRKILLEQHNRFNNFIDVYSEIAHLPSATTSQMKSMVPSITMMNHKLSLGRKTPKNSMFPYFKYVQIITAPAKIILPDRESEFVSTSSHGLKALAVKCDEQFDNISTLVPGKRAYFFEDLEFDSESEFTVRRVKNGLSHFSSETLRRNVNKLEGIYREDSSRASELQNRLYSINNSFVRLFSRSNAYVTSPAKSAYRIFKAFAVANKTYQSIATSNHKVRTQLLDTLSAANNLMGEIYLQTQIAMDRVVRDYNLDFEKKFSIDGLVDSYLSDSNRQFWSKFTPVMDSVPEQYQEIDNLGTFFALYSQNQKVIRSGFDTDVEKQYKFLRVMNGVSAKLLDSNKSITTFARLQKKPIDYIAGDVNKDVYEAK